MRLLSELDCDLVGVADPSDDARAFAAETYGVATYADYRELEGKVDAVSVVVPTKMHREVGCFFLERGVDVLVEKPIARSVADGQALVDAAAANGRILAVGHVERFNPALRGIEAIGKAARYIESHRLAPFSFRSTDIGVVLDLMMPRLGGLETAQAIRSAERRAGPVEDAGLPIVAITAKASDADRQLCLDLGMNGFVSKPYRYEELQNLIAELGL